MIDKKEIKFKNCQTAKPSLTIENKNCPKKTSKEISSQLSSLENENNYKEIENEEYGYELEQSSGSDLNKQEENKNLIMQPYYNEKSNGENININDFNSQNNNNKDFIFLPLSKININKNNNRKNINNNNNILLCNSLNTNGNSNKNKYNEVDNDWNNPKINFDGISEVSKRNSYENNYNENSNIIDNYLNSPITSNNILFKSVNFDNNNNYKSLNIIKEKQNIKDLNISQKINKNPNQNILKKYNEKPNNISIEKHSNEDIKNNFDDNNIINKLKNENIELEEKLKKEKLLNKENNNYIEILKNNILQDKNNIINNPNKLIKDKNGLGLILEYSKYKIENENIKKSIIIQNILTEDMKKELINLKNENKKLEEEISQYKNKNNNIKEKLKEYETKLNERKNNEDDLKTNLNKQKKICLNLQREINTLKQKNDDLIELNEKISKEKCVVNIEEKGLEDYKNILHEKNNIIKELKLENSNLIKEIEIKDKKNDNIQNNNSEKILNDQIENMNNNIKSKEFEIYKMKTNENNYKKIINDLYENIKGISHNIKLNANNITEDYLNKMNKINIQFFKEINEQINTDNNGNISFDEKTNTINEFNNILNRYLELLFNQSIPIKKDIHNNIVINHCENNNLFNSPNGQNNLIYSNNVNNTDKYNKSNIITRINSYNKKYINNDMFKKIDLNLNHYNNLTSDNNRIFRYNNRFKITDPNISKKDSFRDNSKINSNLLEKNSIIFKSNLSPFNKDNLNVNTIHNQINAKYNELANSIFNDDKKKRKNNKISLKVKELTDLIYNNNNQKTNKSFKNIEGNLVIKNIKKTKKDISGEVDKINNTINIFPSNSKVKDNNKSEILLSLTNFSTARRNIKDLLEEKNISYKKTLEVNTNENINSPLLNLPIILNYSSNNHKKTNSSANDYLNKNKDIKIFEKLDFNKNQQNNNILNENFYKINAKSEKNTINLDSNRLNDISSNTSNIKKKFFIKIGNNSSSFLESIRNKNTKNKNKKALNQKILIKQRILEKENNNTLDINGLANEVMKPTFLKNNILISLNNNNSGKGKDNVLFKETKNKNPLSINKK